MTEPDLPQPEQNTGDIQRLVGLRMLDDNLFRNHVNDLNMNGSLYGGQVLAQALRAALHTVEDRACHSLHGYFIRAGDGDRPVIYDVERTRDGKSFTTRRVTAIQHGVPIFHMEASFNVAEDGLEHEDPPSMGAPDPESLPTLQELADQFADRLDETTRSRLLAPRTIDVRLVDAERLFLRRSETARNAIWMRVPTAAGGDEALQACALAYASDAWLALSARMKHTAPFDISNYQLASIDHAMWFHRPSRADEWVLYETQSPWGGGGRGLTRGQMYDRQGRLITSTAQEVLMRRRKAA